MANYYIDKNTRNYSFIEMHHYLQDNGCENNDFMLRTYDKDLLDFNMYQFFSGVSKDKRTILNDKILTECKKNIWFFLREILKFDIVQDNISYPRYESFPLYMGVPFILTKENMALIYLFDNGVSFTDTYIYDIGSDDSKAEEHRHVNSIKTTLDALMYYKAIVLNEYSIINKYSSADDIDIDKAIPIRCNYIFGNEKSSIDGYIINDSEYIDDPDILYTTDIFNVYALSYNGDTLFGKMHLNDKISDIINWTVNIVDGEVRFNENNKLFSFISIGITDDNEHIHSSAYRMLNKISKRINVRMNEILLSIYETSIQDLEKEPILIENDVTF